MGKVPEHALHATMTATNWQLHRSSIDDTLSGCTACTAFLQARPLLGGLCWCMMGRGGLGEGVLLRLFLPSALALGENLTASTAPQPEHMVRLCDRPLLTPAPAAGQHAVRGQCG